MKRWQIHRTAGIFTTTARRLWLIHQCFCLGLPVAAFLLKWEQKESISDWAKALPRQLEISWNTEITKSLKLRACCSWGKTHQLVLQITESKVRIYGKRFWVWRTKAYAMTLLWLDTEVRSWRVSLHPELDDRQGQTPISHQLEGHSATMWKAKSQKLLCF